MKHDYQAAENAFRDGLVAKASDADLTDHLLALANQPIDNEKVKHRDIIRGITINHILMQRHIDNLNKQNAKTQRWVIALAVAALISSLVQIFSPLLFQTQTNASTQQAPAMQSVASPQEMPQKNESSS